MIIAELLASGSELLFLCRECGWQALSYPIQSIRYFSGCVYNISILNSFVLLQAIRLLGYIFLAAAVILLCVTIKKPLFVVFVPCSLCLLQQFLFTEGSTAYYLPTVFLRATRYFRGEIYQIKNGKAECIIPDGNQLNMVAFDWKRIYYINHSLELMAYDVAGKQFQRLAGGFVKSLYYDGSRLLYSNKDGIYSMNTTSGAAESLTEITAEQISSDGSRIVFYADETLYLLGDEITALMHQKLLHFSMISNTDMVYYVYYGEGENVSGVLEI